MTILGATSRDPRKRVLSGSGPNLFICSAAFVHENYWDFTWSEKTRQGSLGQEGSLLSWGEPSRCPYPATDSWLLVKRVFLPQSSKSRQGILSIFVIPCCIIWWYVKLRRSTSTEQAGNSNFDDLKTWISPEATPPCTRTIIATGKNIRSSACVKYIGKVTAHFFYHDKIDHSEHHLVLFQASQHWCSQGFTQSEPGRPLDVLEPSRAYQGPGFTAAGRCSHILCLLHWPSARAGPHLNLCHRHDINISQKELVLNLAPQVPQRTVVPICLHLGMSQSHALPLIWCDGRFCEIKRVQRKQPICNKVYQGISPFSACRTACHSFISTLFFLTL